MQFGKRAARPPRMAFHHVANLLNMQIKTFFIPVTSPERSESDANRFLRSHRVLRTERHFVPTDGGFWAVLVEYADGDPVAEAPPVERREKKDYAKVLSAEEYRRYEIYRERRKQLATQYAVPAYVIFSNDELAILARQPQLNAATVKNVKGIAPSHLNDYVEQFYGLADEVNADEAGGASN